MNDEIHFEVVKMTGCAICKGPVIYLGPAVLANGRRYCSDACSALDIALSPGQWVSADELAPGGSLHDRPELWADD